MFIFSTVGTCHYYGHDDVITVAKHKHGNDKLRKILLFSAVINGSHNIV